jgi:ribosomal RNA-processing protein 1
MGKELASTGEQALLDVSDLINTQRDLLRLFLDKRTRDDAVNVLRDFLATTGEKPMPDLEMAKLWKGIFYCTRLNFFGPLTDYLIPALGFWLSDKPLVQQELSTSLADLLLVIPTKDASFQFLRGFWHAIVREWPGLDYLR